MKIVRLQAENVKRLTAVDIMPDGALVELTGANMQGKSSCLDSIFYALAGKGVIPTTPIRRGQDHAIINLDLGDIQVRRTFNAQEDGAFTTSVVVENKDGARFQKPQDILNALVGEFTFDPLEFATRLKPAEQIDILKRFVKDFDFDADERAQKADFEKRADINRRAKELRAEAQTIQVPPDAPEALVDETAILAELRGAGQKNAELERAETTRRRETADIERVTAEASRMFADAEELRRRARLLDQEATNLTEEVEARTAALQALPELAVPVDTADLTARLQSAQAANAAHAKAVRRREAVAAAEAKETESANLTAAMEARKAARAKAVSDADMPVPGLGFAGGEVTLNGLPFDQASGAEQLRASVAIAAALNPKLRIAFIRDASRLDSKAVQALSEFAAEHDLQVWMETVEQNRPAAIIIEDGTVRQPNLMAAE